MPRLLIVDDEPAICWGLERLGESMGLEVDSASSAEEGLRKVDDREYDIVFLDVRLPGMDGLEAMPRLRPRLGDAPLVVMTAYGDLATAVEATRRGAFEYLIKPFDLDQAEKVIRHALAAKDAPAPAVATEPETIDGFVGRSPRMQEVFKRIALAAASDAPVLLSGESGTGKELAARAIHRYSARANGPFVALNVAALNPSLAESELFGHARGAFTGADAPRTGLLELAAGGTLFLDEVADIPPSLQVKLLRCLELQEVTPVGSNQPRKTDYRIVAATHRDLGDLIRTGAFREDLYFRLSALRIELPPLRERIEDLPALAESFLRRAEQGSTWSGSTFDAEALAELQRRNWPGNVRELRHAVESARLLARGGRILPMHLEPAARATSKAAPQGQEEPDEFLRRLLAEYALRLAQERPESGDWYERFLSLVEPPFLEATLARYRQQCAAAARALGIHRTTLRKKLDQYGIQND
jgi:two-component system nitrogen regulation response regulator GlnG